MLLVATASLAVAQVNYCPGASPFDQTPDDVPLQQCLQGGGTIALQAGLPGYIIANTLTIAQNNTVLTSASASMATLRASTTLFGPILQSGDTLSGYEISWIRFNGWKQFRVANLYCAGYRTFGYNLWLKGSGYRVHDVESMEAPCGSSMELSGSGFEVWNNSIHNNGLPREGSSDPEPWADGITLISCSDGYVHDNQLTDNTDIDIVVGGGPRCRIQRNTITHTYVYGFAGIHVGNFNSNGNHAGSDYSSNTINAALDKLGFGVIAGFHPWDPRTSVPDAGTVYSNTATGSVVNVAVDGIDWGNIQANPASGASGTRGVNCNQAADYTAGHFGAAALQSGYICRIYHAPSCQNTCG